MSRYFEIGQTETGDARMVARVLAHRGRFVRARLHDPASFAEPPELSWTWEAPAPLADWLPAVDMLRACSVRMAEIVRANLGPRDHVQWLPASVRTPDGQTRPYEVPHFLAYPDVYDVDATDWGPSGLPIRWVLSRAKLEGLHFFARPEASGTVIVADALLSALREASITGMDVRPVRMNP